MKSYRRTRKKTIDAAESIQGYEPEAKLLNGSKHKRGQCRSEWIWWCFQKCDQSARELVSLVKDGKVKESHSATDVLSN